MYDFIKISYNIPNPEDLLQTFDFKSEVSRSTGEVGSMAVYEFGDLAIRVHEKGLILVLGSVHKQHNNGANYNDFTLMDFIEVVENMSSTLNLDLWHFKPDTLEIGVNTTPCISTKILLRYSLLHGHKPFKNVSCKNQGDYRQIEYQHYIIKLYDKGKQYDLDKDVLRFEIKMRPGILRKLNVNHLYDLLSPDFTKQFGELLESHFREILFIDPTIEKTKLNARNLNNLKNWSNINYWTELYENPPSKNKPSREINRCKSLNLDYSEDIHGKTLKNIIDKWSKLSDFPDHEIISKVGSFNTSIIELIFPNKRLCEVTRLDISMQRSDSRFLSLSGVRFYYENDIDIYNNLKQRLSDRWIFEPIEKQFTEIAHSIRNEYFNKRHNARKSLKRITDQGLLFKLTDVVDSKYLMLAELDNNSHINVLH